jgi:hypothetical protein
MATGDAPEEFGNCAGLFLRRAVRCPFRRVVHSRSSGYQPPSRYRKPVRNYSRSGTSVVWKNLRQGLPRVSGSNVELAGSDADGDIVAFSGTVDNTGTILKLNYIVNGSPREV